MNIVQGVAEMTSKGTLVLVIDDDPEMQEMVRLSAQADWIPQAFGTAAEVQRWLRQQQEGIIPADAAILDLNLEAEGSGFAVLQELCRRGVPVAVVSGRAGKEERKVAMLSGATAVFSKPVSPEEIRAWVETVAGNGHHRMGAVRLPNGWLLARDGTLTPPEGQASEPVTLTPTQSKIVRLLALAGGMGVPKRNLYTLAQSYTALRVQISRLRKAIAPLGLDIRSEDEVYFLVRHHE